MVNGKRSRSVNFILYSKANALIIIRLTSNSKIKETVITKYYIVLFCVSYDIYKYWPFLRLNSVILNYCYKNYYRVFAVSFGLSTRMTR